MLDFFWPKNMVADVDSSRLSLAVTAGPAVLQVPRRYVADLPGLKQLRLCPSSGSPHCRCDLVICLHLLLHARPLHDCMPYT